jgi:hypothetical protein
VLWLKDVGDFGPVCKARRFCCNDTLHPSTNVHWMDDDSVASAGVSRLHTSGSAVRGISTDKNQA